jgi:hypothetical protein
MIQELPGCLYRPCHLVVSFFLRGELICGGNGVCMCVNGIPCRPPRRTLDILHYFSTILRSCLFKYLPTYTCISLITTQMADYSTIVQIQLPLTHWPSLEIRVTWTERRAQVRPKSHRLKHRSRLGQPGLIALCFYKNSTTEPPTLKSWSGHPILKQECKGGRLGRDFNFVF